MEWLWKLHRRFDQLPKRDGFISTRLMAFLAMIILPIFMASSIQLAKYSVIFFWTGGIGWSILLFLLISRMLYIHGNKG